MGWLNRVCCCVVSTATHGYQQQQLPGKPGESRVTSPQHDKENLVTSSSSRSSSRSIFGCVELLAETSCSRPPPHLAVVSPPYLVTHVDQSPSSRYRHVTSSSPAAMFAAVTSPPVAVRPTPVIVATIYRYFLLITPITVDLIISLPRPTVTFPAVWHLYFLTTTNLYLWPVWRNDRAFACDPKGRGFESQPVRFQVIVLDKLLTRMCLCHQAV